MSGKFVRKFLCEILVSRLGKSNVICVKKTILWVRTWSLPRGPCAIPILWRSLRHISAWQSILIFNSIIQCRHYRCKWVNYGISWSREPWEGTIGGLWSKSGSKSIGTKNWDWNTLWNTFKETMFILHLSMSLHCWWFRLVVRTDPLMMTKVRTQKNRFFHTYHIWFPKSRNQHFIRELWGHFFWHMDPQ